MTSPLNDAPFCDQTTEYWQSVVTAEQLPVSPAPPYQRGYPAKLPDGRYLVLPLRAIPNHLDQCVTSLIANQASFEVIETLAEMMASACKDLNVEVVVGLPTLGLMFAPLVAQKLG